MKRSLTCLCAAGLIASLAGPAPADDLVIPPWFVHPKGTYEHWDFSAMDNQPPPAPPYPPDRGVINPFGGPTMTIGGNGALYFNEHQGRPQCWQLAPGSSMTFDIPNAGATAPKITWIQVTYWSFVNTRPAIAMPGFVEVAAFDIPVGPAGSGWRWNGSIWVSQTCPPVETITLTPGAANDFPYIDQVVIDTICLCDNLPPGGDHAVPEVELCGDDANGGCNSTPLVFESIAPDSAVSGTAWALDGVRDTDWYEVALEAPGHLLWAANTEFPAALFILTDACPPTVLASAFTDDSPVGGHAAAFADNLEPGVYRLFIAPGSADGGLFDGLPCDAGGNAYAASVSAVPALALPGPPNDRCADRIDITDGSTTYSTVGADTDGLPHAACQFDGQTYHDVWFNYVATCDGALTVSTCNAADYDTDLAVYAACDVCPPDDAFLLGCNDDAPDCAGFTSMVTVPVVCGQCYKIRVGGWNQGDQGTGVLTLTCDGTPCTGCPCAWDLDGDCIVGPTDLASLLANWGSPYGPSDLAALLAEWGCSG
ncbi:MAG: hypothetical protein KDA25_00540 [Phycisphaerales bacterium]|nr:hypothetical protein [Phycisphaerales bacterium]